MSNLRIVTNPEVLNYGKVIDPTSGEQLVPVVVVDTASLATYGLSAIRMQGWANPEAVQNTLASRLTTFYSRSKQGLWVKGGQSGNILPVNEAYTDCDFDCLLLDVSPSGPTCHTGAVSCFNLEPIGE